MDSEQYKCTAAEVAGTRCLVTSQPFSCYAPNGTPLLICALVPAVSLQPSAGSETISSFPPPSAEPMCHGSVLLDKIQSNAMNSNAAGCTGAVDNNTHTRDRGNGRCGGATTGEQSGNARDGVTRRSMRISGLRANTSGGTIAPSNNNNSGPGLGRAASAKTRNVNSGRVLGRGRGRARRTAHVDEATAATATATAAATAADTAGGTCTGANMAAAAGDRLDGAALTAPTELPTHPLPTMPQEEGPMAAGTPPQAQEAVEWYYVASFLTNDAAIYASAERRGGSGSGPRLPVSHPAVRAALLGVCCVLAAEAGAFGEISRRRASARLWTVMASAAAMGVSPPTTAEWVAAVGLPPPLPPPLPPSLPPPPPPPQPPQPQPPVLPNQMDIPPSRPLLLNQNQQQPSATPIQPPAFRNPHLHRSSPPSPLPPSPLPSQSQSQSNSHSHSHSRGVAPIPITAQPEKGDQEDGGTNRQVINQTDNGQTDRQQQQQQQQEQQEQQKQKAQEKEQEQVHEQQEQQQEHLSIWREAEVCQMGEEDQAEGQGQEVGEPEAKRARLCEGEGSPVAPDLPTALRERIAAIETAAADVVMLDVSAFNDADKDLVMGTNMANISRDAVGNTGGGGDREDGSDGSDGADGADGGDGGDREGSDGGDGGDAGDAGDREGSDGGDGGDGGDGREGSDGGDPIILDSRGTHHGVAPEVVGGGGEAAATDAATVATATDAAVAVSPAAAPPMHICLGTSMKAPLDVGPNTAYRNFIQARAPLASAVTTATSASAVIGSYKYLDGCAPKGIHGMSMGIAKVTGGGVSASGGVRSGVSVGIRCDGGDWRDSDDEWMLPSASQIEALVQGKRVGSVLGCGATTKVAAVDPAGNANRSSDGGGDDSGGWCESDDDMCLPSASQIDALVARYK